MTLTEVGSNVLASLGHDGQTKRRGQNTDVATLNNWAYVGGGALFSGVRSSAGRVCTDYGGVKVVNLSNPAAPVVTNTIQVADLANVNQGPTGNPRRGANVPNVAASVASVHAMHHPVLNKDILAIATQRCEQPFSTARIEFWDVTTPTSPVMLATSSGGTSPTNGPASYEDVNMFTRNNGPGGSTKVYAMVASPFQSVNFRVIDITTLSLAVQPTVLAHYPSSVPGTFQDVGDNTQNGCRIFSSPRNAKPTPDKSGAIVGYYDGTQPTSSKVQPTALGTANSAAAYKFDLDAMPTIDTQPVTAIEVQRFATANNPKTWGYPPAADGGMDAAGLIEGNVADVEPFTGPNGELLSFVTEEDIDPSLTNVSITSPAGTYPDTRGCEMYIAEKLFEQPGQELAGEVAYVGRGCPASDLANSFLPVEDPYLENPAGKIALLDGAGDLFNRCSITDQAKRAAAAGAIGVTRSLSCCPSNNTFIGTGEGPPPAIPAVGVQFKQYNKMAGYLPSGRVLTGSGYPAAWNRTSTTNVTVRQRAMPITASSNATPIQISVAATTPHLLNVGDRVSIYQVPGNTAANGNWLVKTVPTTTTFTIWDGVNDAVGNGASQAGGVVVFCPPGSASCAAQRGDISRFKSVSNATDLVARGAVIPTVVTVAAPGRAAAAPRNVGRNYRVETVPVEPLPTALPAGAVIRFENNVQVPLSAAAAAGDTIISAQFPGDPDSINGPLPTGTKGSVAGEVVPLQNYKAGVDLEMESRTDGTFRAAVVWYDNTGAFISEDEIGSRSAVGPRSRSTVTVQAPVNAKWVTTKFEWTGATVGGTAYADSFSFVPDALAVKFQALPGGCSGGAGYTAWPPTPAQCGAAKPAWGAQKIIDFTGATPTQIGSYQSPNAQVWPPPDDGIYMPTQARMFGKDVAFTTWMSDGLRVLNVKDPAAPVEVASIVPAPMTDPSPDAGAGITNRRDGSPIVRGPSWPDRTLIVAVDIIPTGQGTGYAVLSDVNAGLRVIKFEIHRTGTSGLFQPLAPARILDTRNGTGSCTPSPCAKLGSGGNPNTIDLQVTGQGGVPVGGVSAVVMNVTVTNPSTASVLTAFPSDVAQPSVSNLNYVAGQTVPNLVTVKVGADGKVKLNNAFGDVDVIADVAGWYTDTTGTAGARFNALSPSRVLDTRNATGSCTPSPCAKLGSGGNPNTIDVQVAGQGGVPAMGAAGPTAVIMNVTVTNPSTGSVLTAFPSDVSQPAASNLNYVAGQTVPNLVTVKLGADGKVKINNAFGDVDVIADVAGWYSTDTATTGARFTALSPSRILDTRFGTGTCTPSPCAQLVGNGAELSLQVSGQGGVPASGASAVIMNGTVTQPTAASVLTVFPSDVAAPTASNLNYVAGETVPNLIAVKLGADGRVKVNNAFGNVHVIADVAGWFNSE